MIAVGSAQVTCTIARFFSRVSRMHRIIFAAAVFLTATCSPSPAQTAATGEAPATEKTFDVVIVGNSSGSVGAAIGAGRLGVKVALIDPTPVLGGMLANGISNIDSYSYESLSGVFEEFRQAVKAHYQPLLATDPVFKVRERKSNHIDGRSFAAHEPWEGGVWEPKVAQQIFKKMVAELPNVEVFPKRYPVKVTVENNRLVAVQTDGDGGPITFRGKVFVDTTHEADVAAWAGVPFRVGREARSELEPHAGKIYFFNHTGEFLPGSTGEQDRAVPSYGLRLCIQNFPAESGDAHILKEPPPGYDKNKFQHASYNGKPSMPNGKAEMNVNPVGNELQEINWDWPEATRDERAALAVTYRNNALSYLYFLQHELGKTHLGLPTDEFTDNDFVPYLVFTRECRRINGLANMTEADINPFIKGEGFIPPPQPTSIAVGEYPIDAKPVRSKTDVSTPDKGEGDYYLVNASTAFQVPYGSIVPQKVDGLLVPVALSATHVAFSAVRMDPTWTVLGQSAGIAAALCAQRGVQPRELPVDYLQEVLVRQQLKISFFWDVDASHKDFVPIQLLSVRQIATGDANRCFRPDEPLTRAEACKLLVRTFGLWPSISNVHFTDVPHTHPNFREVETLFDNGALTVFGVLPRWPAENGYDASKHAGFRQNNSFGPFLPDQPVTPDEFNRLLGALKQKMLSQEDVIAYSQPLTRGRACSLIWKLLSEEAAAGH